MSRQNVVALISGGKDSIFSILHCLANGHRVVALANLYPPPAARPVAAAAAAAAARPTGDGKEEGEKKAADPSEAAARQWKAEDVDSHMYQTVGHAAVVPLYGEALGLPLYRQEILGSAVNAERCYQPRRRRRSEGAVDGKAEEDKDKSGGEGGGGREAKHHHHGAAPDATVAAADHAADHAADYAAEHAGEHAYADEAESLVPLLQRVLRQHPEVDAVSSGAVLSDYQRTRIESAAARLGLVSLAYLWQFPALAPPGTASALLADMAAVGLDARMVKCASGGLDASFLWENVADTHVAARIVKAVSRFAAADAGGGYGGSGGGGGGGAACLGEGGEYETLMLDGPPPLWKKAIVVDDADRAVVHGGEGSAILSIRAARLVPKKQGPVDDSVESKDDRKSESQQPAAVRIPELLDENFGSLLRRLTGNDGDGAMAPQASATTARESGLAFNKDDQPGWKTSRGAGNLYIWNITAPEAGPSAERQMDKIVPRLRGLLEAEGVSADNITFASIYLRTMGSFPSVNKIYGTLFSQPNPPARATVGAGDLLPAGVDLSLSVIVWLGPRRLRDGLHVQSRSYWAPANIGPYSQAIAVPPTLQTAVDSPPQRLVYVAGQIPLVPASLEIVQPMHYVGAANTNNASLGLSLRTTLALQHLWRIGKAMNVGWWTNGIAFLAGGDHAGIAHKAWTAWQAWTHAHHRNSADGAGAGGADDEDDDDVDLWEQRYGSAKEISFDKSRSSGHALPDYDSVRCQAASSSSWAGGDRPPPPFMAVQLNELPRGSDIEWMATGVAGARVTLSGHQDGDDGKTVAVERCVLDGTGTAIVQIAFGDAITDERLSKHIRQSIEEEANSCSAWSGMEQAAPASDPAAACRRPRPLLITVYTSRDLSVPSVQNVELVRCLSIWGMNGCRLAAGVIMRFDH
jgi:diphthine-ammonia ligase